MRARSSHSPLLAELRGLPFVILSAKQEASSAVMVRIRGDHGFENAWHTADWLNEHRPSSLGPCFLVHWGNPRCLEGTAFPGSVRIEGFFF